MPAAQEPALIPTIGLEVHCQLFTKSKMFCSCAVSHGASPNTHVCPVCLGHPGALPVLNDAAVRLGVRAGMALGCTVHERSILARKHYFYPDLSKGYQISQFDRPLCTSGQMHCVVDGQRAVYRIQRIHLEEDAGKLRHDGNRSRIDFNRSGTPLLEVVGDPDLHSAEAAEAWLRMLHRVVVDAGVCTGDMEKGHFRCDANVSVAEEGAELGTRVELKNINSFRFVAKAIRGEIARQRELIRGGERIVQQTRSWTSRGSVALRSKEEAADYRYLPEPDLGCVCVTEDDRSAAADVLAGLPLDVHLLDEDAAQLDALCAQTGLAQSEIAPVRDDAALMSLYRASIEVGGDPGRMIQWLRGPVSRWLNKQDERPQSVALTGAHLVQLERLISEGRLNRGSAESLISALAEDGGDVLALVKARDLGRIDDDDLIDQAVAEVVAANPAQVARYRAGQAPLLGFFMGQVMSRFSGRADPGRVQARLRRVLDGDG